ncbi:hypothetical protein RhiirA4_480525 [Rhizophagus irregularis]|uniref:Uncharacterized protein n=1 Tax=Rhizophagus irregularis TaxID=588596 RepID=A0A2I1HI45_9GLOM|nr:hypothetical protein RhiirA4_480525 [Rhizophagus irregularis]
MIPNVSDMAVEIILLSEDYNLLVEEIATILLNDIGIGRLSITALQYFLFYTYYDKEIPFATPERYIAILAAKQISDDTCEVFRYYAILAAKQVSNDTYKTFMELLAL